MRYATLLISCLLVLSGCSSSSAPAENAALSFEGARLIHGDASVVDNSAILVENGKISKVGKRVRSNCPPGGARIDLTGKTVMPAIVDAHAHLGWQIIKTGQIGKETYTKDNLIDHLKRVAYYGVAATQNLGIDPGETPYEVRAEPVPGAALFRTAGRGIAMPNAGPGQEYRRTAAYGVTTEAEARKAVQELAAKKVDIVKIWVDDRNGTVKKLPPAHPPDGHRRGAQKQSPRGRAYL